MAGNVRESKTILTAEDRTGGAFASMMGGLKSMQAQSMALQASLVGLAGSVGAAAFAKMVDDTAKARAALDDLADSGLGTVESLSKLQQNVRAFGGEHCVVRVAGAATVKMPKPVEPPVTPAEPAEAAA